MNDLLQRYRISRLKKRWQERQLPAEIGAYLDCASENPKRRAGWEPLRFVVLDTETTGLDLKRDHLLTFGAVAVQHQRIRIGDSLDLVVWAEVADRHEQVPLHGILPTESAQGIPELMAATRILNFIGSAVLVGHHINFDVIMIEKMIQAHLPGFFLHNRRLDTAHLARQLIYPHHPPAYIRRSEFTLDTLMARYGLTDWNRHTAQGDAMITAELLLTLLSEAARRQRTRLKDIGG